MCAQQVPEQLTHMAQNPLLLIYKFTAPIYSLEIDIKKHTGTTVFQAYFSYVVSKTDIDVLIAEISHAHFIVNYNEKGSLLYKLVFSVFIISTSFIFVANCISISKKIRLSTLRSNT